METENEPRVLLRKGEPPTVPRIRWSLLRTCVSWGEDCPRSHLARIGDAAGLTKGQIAGDLAWLRTEHLLDAKPDPAVRTHVALLYTPTPVGRAIAFPELVQRCQPRRRTKSGR